MTVGFFTLKLIYGGGERLDSVSMSVEPGIVPVLAPLDNLGMCSNRKMISNVS